MSQDSFTEVSTRSWFGRIGGAVKGVVFGFVFFAGSFVLLFWNEGRTVERYNALKEGAGAVKEAAAASIDPANEGKLVYVSGPAATAETLTDGEFGVSVQAIKLIRDVSMYQWEEDKKTETKKNVGGSETTETTYSYRKAWSGRAIDSRQFKHPEGHENPQGMKYSARTFTAGKVTLGAFTLSPSLVERIGNAVNYSVDASTVPAGLGPLAKKLEGGYYLGADPSSPAVGDLKVAFQAVLPGDVSVIAQQARDTFSPYRTKAGGSLEILETGAVPAQSMFSHAEASNSMLGWVLRAAGFLLMLIGLTMMLKPLSVFADVVPLFGSIVGAGTGFVAFIVAAVCSAVTIAVAWFAYRPLLSCCLAGAAAAFLFAFKLRGKGAAPAPAGAPPNEANRA